METLPGFDAAEKSQGRLFLKWIAYGHRFVTPIPFCSTLSSQGNQHGSLSSFGWTVISWKREWACSVCGIPA